MTNLGIGLIGYAFMGAAHSQAWRSAPRFFDLPLDPQLNVLGGRIDFQDATVTPSYWRSLASLALRAEGIRFPPLETDAQGWMAEALAEREPLYASVADRILDTDAAAPADTAASLVAWLLGETACSAVPRVRSGEPT